MIFIIDRYLYKLWVVGLKVEMTVLLVKFEIVFQVINVT
jgi:hypothetical protein